VRNLILAIAITYAAITSSCPACARQPREVILGIAVNEAGTPVSGVQVALLMSNHRTSAVAGQAAVGPDGTFKIAYPRPELTIIPAAMYLAASSDKLLGIQAVNNTLAAQRIVCHPRASVSGTVKDSGGRPVEGAVVSPDFLIWSEFFGQQYLHWREIEPAAGTKPAITDAQGKFTLSGLPAGCGVCLRASKDGVGIGATGSGDPSSGALKPELAIPVGTADIAIILKAQGMKAPTGCIKGWVLNKLTKWPVRGVEVVAVDMQNPSSSPRSMATTQSDGSFQLDGLPRGEYTVSVLEARRPVQPETDVEVSENGTTELTLLAIPGRTFIGQVVDENTGRGVPGVMVVAPGSKPVVTRSKTSPGRLSADGPGSFSINVLPGPGVLLVIGDKQGYGRAHYEIDVPEKGRFTGVRIKLPRATTICGTIRDSSGKPVDGALLRIVSPDGPLDTLQADSKGYYMLTLQGSADMTCDLIAYDEATGEGAIQPATLAARNTNLVDMALGPAARFSGFVKDDTGKPVPGARVTPMLQTGACRIYSMHNRAASDASGRFTIDGLIPGAAYFVRIEADGYEAPPFGKDALPELKSGETASAEFTLRAKAEAPAQP